MPWGETVSSAETPIALRYRSKVPAITIYFWVVKLLTTAMGEATSDSLIHYLNPFLAVGLGAVGFVAALVLQFLTRDYVPWVYWLLVAMVAVFGTMAADVLHKLGMPHLTATIMYGVLLAGIFTLWQRSEKTLAMHSIFTVRRETFTGPRSSSALPSARRRGT